MREINPLHAGIFKFVNWITSQKIPRRLLIFTLPLYRYNDGKISRAILLFILVNVIIVLLIT